MMLPVLIKQGSITHKQWKGKRKKIVNPQIEIKMYFNISVIYLLFTFTHYLSGFFFISVFDSVREFISLLKIFLSQFLLFLKLIFRGFNLLFFYISRQWSFSRKIDIMLIKKFQDMV